MEARGGGKGNTLSFTHPFLLLICSFTRMEQNGIDSLGGVTLTHPLT